MRLKTGTTRLRARYLYLISLFTVFITCSALQVNAVTLEKLISREDPKFKCEMAPMNVGRDGYVYLTGTGYVLRIARDGTEKFGGDVILNGLSNATANAEGVMATANAHFNHAVNIYNSAFSPIGLVQTPAIVTYTCPGEVVAGANDFYAADQDSLSIMHVAPPGRLVSSISLKVNDPLPKGYWYQLRVWEAGKRYFLSTDRPNQLIALDFAGKILWTKDTTVGGNIWDGYRGAFDVDTNGRIYIIKNNEDTVKMFDSDGKADGELKLQLPDRDGLIFWLQVYGNEIIIKRKNPTELFHVYDLATGELKRIVHPDFERVTVEYPSEVWTAGQTTSCKITSSNAAAQWRIWATPFGDADWQELKRNGNEVAVPAGYAGLYQLRIAPTLNPQASSEFAINALIEVRVAESKGTISVWSPLNRVWWGRGEEIPLGVVLRTTAKDTLTASLTLLKSDAKPLWSSAVTLIPNTETAIMLPAATTQMLSAGRYTLRVNVPGYTCVAQPICLGPGLEWRSPFRVSLHGDYNVLHSTADAWSFADAANAILYRSQTLGINQYINRIFAGRYPLTFVNNADGAGLLQAMEKRLTADPAGVSPQKVAFGFADAHAMGALGANGMREWLILVGMDTALPIGASFPWAAGIKPEVYAEEITKYTKPLSTLPGFAGWDWVANWWVADPKLRFATPEENTAYDEALKVAKASGEWNPVLDTVGDRTIGWQREAQQGFKEALDKVAPNLATASAGPYRRPEVYPPISFNNVDEVDLHFQAEQISTPNWTAHAPDFYARPGKPAWIHPELHNDTGTGEMILPFSWLALMRGADGIGAAGDIPFAGSQPDDSRSGHAGTLSVFRALHTVAQQYGPWLTTLENADRVAIVVSHREIKLDPWGGVGGLYFTRLWEAYQSCLYARQPATFLYTEDVKTDTLSRFKAIMLVGQTYQPEPALASLLAQAKQQGIAIFADSTCRETLVKDYLPLGLAFDHIEKLNGFNNDCAFWDFPEALLANAPLVAAKLAAVVPPVAEVDQAEVLVSVRRSGNARFVWVVNNTHSQLDKAQLWRLNNAVAARMPAIAKVKLPLAKGEVVYDLFTGSKVSGDCIADLRYSQARLYAVLPGEIKQLRLTIPAKLLAGQSFNWSADVPGITGKLPIHLILRDASGALVDERYTTTGSGTLRVPTNALLPVTVLASELISGKTAGVSRVKSDLQVPFAAQNFGPRLRDIAISPDGSTALLNAFNWGENSYGLDLATGKQRWSGNIGSYFSYEPMAARDGFALQGFDLATPEGYQLYRLDAKTGIPTRRFALPGLPNRLLGWAFPIVSDRINNFALAPDGSWVAGAGDLALVVWSADGTILWSQDWSASKRVAPRILAIDNNRLLVASGMKLTSYQALTGEELWTVTPDHAGEILGLCASADGNTVAARANTRSGRVFVVREGKVIGTLPTAADEIVLSNDGIQLAVTTGNELKWYTAAGSLQWVYQGDAVLRSPRLSPDGKRLAVGSEVGTFYMCDLASGEVTARDFAALPVAAWLPNGDYLVATWMGMVYRFTADGKELWHLLLPGAEIGTAPALDIPTTRYRGWLNAEATPLPLTPNLLASTKVSIKAQAGTSNLAFEHPVTQLFDGQPNSAETPWLKWTDIGMIDSGWRGSFTLEFDSSPVRLKLTAITFVEDAKHPESWLHDARLEYWDTDRWVLAQYLTADSAIHTHKLAKPVAAVKFRLACPYGSGWPIGNLRFGEIVLHGEAVLED